MPNDQSTIGSSNRSWLDRLVQLFDDEPEDKEDIVEILHNAKQRALLDTDALAMMEGVLGVSELRVRDIMIPRAQMTLVNRNDALEDILPVIIESAHSRFPVVGGDKGEVQGILLAKDLLQFFANAAAFNIRDVLRSAVFVPESKRLNVLLKEFRASRNHMAIVVDEYGGVAGMVTIEDVLEQIVGEIEDEHDVEEDDTIRKHSEMHYTIKALTPIEDFNEYFGTDLADDEFDTMGGLVVHAIGHLPKRGERIVIGNMLFKVLRADSRRVHMLQLTMLPRPVEDEADLLNVNP